MKIKSDSLYKSIGVSRKRVLYGRQVGQYFSGLYADMRNQENESLFK